MIPLPQGPLAALSPVGGQQLLDLPGPVGTCTTLATSLAREVEGGPLDAAAVGQEVDTCTSGQTRYRKGLHTELKETANYRSANDAGKLGNQNTEVRTMRASLQTTM